MIRTAAAPDTPRSQQNVIRTLLFNVSLRNGKSGCFGQHLDRSTSWILWDLEPPEGDRRTDVNVKHSNLVFLLLLTIGSACSGLEHRAGTIRQPLTSWAVTDRAGRGSRNGRRWRQRTMRSIRSRERWDLLSIFLIIWWLIRCHDNEVGDWGSHHEV